jgi:uncharacterized membrane protein YdjX (TVP38/TMEM64 family)
MNTVKSPNTKLIGIISLLMIICMGGAYLYLLHTGAAQIFMKSIHSLGLMGIIFGIAIQAIVNILPVPGEFISIFLMEIFGPIWGGVYAWSGGVIGAVGALYLTKWIAKPLFGKMAKPYLNKMEEYIQNHEKIGLLLIRFVPFVPYHFVNYAAGLLKINIWSFIWTTGLGILPFYIGMVGIYTGLRKGSWIWGAAGAGVFALLIFLSWNAKKKQKERGGGQK